MGYYLMIKTIDQTGMKYLCKCMDNKNHIAYTGSGTYWKRILKKHPEYTVSTEVLGWYPDNASLRTAGLHFSKIHSVVESEEWANYMPEMGDGGSTVKGRRRVFDPITLKERLIDPADDIPDGWSLGGCLKGPRDPEITARIVAKQRGTTRTPEARSKMSLAWTSNIRSAMPKKLCACGREITAPNFIRHVNKCKGNQNGQAV